MQFGHAVGLRPLPAHHTNDVTVQLACLEGSVQGLLRVKHPRRRFNDMPIMWHGRNLDHAAAQVALQQLQAASEAERLGGAAHYRFVF